MKKLLLSILVMASFNLYAQNVSQKDADIAVKRVLSYIYGKYLSDLEEKEEHQLGKKKVWYLGKDDNDCDIFAVEAVYGTGGNGVFKRLFLAPTKYTCYYINDDNSELVLNLAVDYDWKIEKQTKQPPNSEFLLNFYEKDTFSANPDPSPNNLKYKQKYRFNNQTLKFEPMGKKQFVGKKKY